MAYLHELQLDILLVAPVDVFVLVGLEVLLVAAVVVAGRHLGGGDVPDGHMTPIQTPEIGVALSHVVTSKEKKRTKLQMAPPTASAVAVSGHAHLTPGSSGAMGGGGIIGAHALTGSRSELINHQRGFGCQAASFKDISGVAGLGPGAVLDTVCNTRAPLAGCG